MDAVITATPNGMGDLVVRWRFTVSGPALLSASRGLVMIHGPVDLASIEPWLDGAGRAHEALKARRLEAGKGSDGNGSPAHQAAMGAVIRFVNREPEAQGNAS